MFWVFSKTGSNPGIWSELETQIKASQIGLSLTALVMLLLQIFKYKGTIFCSHGWDEGRNAVSGGNSRFCTAALLQCVLQFTIQDSVFCWSFDIYKDLPLWSTWFHTRTDIPSFLLTLSYCLLSQPFSLGNSAFPTFMLMNLYVGSFLETPQPTSSIKAFVSSLNHSWRSLSTVVLTGNVEWYQLVKRAGRIELFWYCKCIFLRVFAFPFHLWLLHLPITA